MKIIGLTGAVASGKNFIAEIFKKHGAAVFDADFEVHQLLEFDDRTITEVKVFFPEAFNYNKIDRKILGKIVFSDDKKLKILEEILHPKVRKKYQEFLFEKKTNGTKIAVLNIPLLLETEGYDCDFIVAISASKTTRKKRYLERMKKNSESFNQEIYEKIFEQICKKQIDDAERQQMADVILNNEEGRDISEIESDVIQIITQAA